MIVGLCGLYVRGAVGDCRDQACAAHLFRGWRLVSFAALIETVTLAVGLKDRHVVSNAIEQGPGEAFGAKGFGPFVDDRSTDRYTMPAGHV